MQRNQSTELLFELSHPGRRTHRLPACDVPAPEAKELLPAATLATTPPPLPEVGEIDLIRHFVNLSAKNMSIDTNFYPLGSCTMKYNPKRHERMAHLPGMADLHPLQTDESCQGMLALLWELQNILAEIAGLDVVSLQPAAGAHGELTALLVAHAYFRVVFLFPIALTAPTPPAPRLPASTPSRCQATTRAWWTLPICAPSSTTVRPSL